jgi:hypothetical protein
MNLIKHQSMRGRDMARIVALVTRCCAVLFLGSVFSWVLLLGPSATPASASGACTGTINGESLGAASTPESAINVDQNASVPVSGTIIGASPTQTISYKVTMSFDVFGDDVRWQVASGSATGNQWASTVDVAKYAKYGTGLYYVKATATTSQGASCSVGGFVNVNASNLSDAAIAGIALGSLGIIGVGAATASAVSQANKVTEAQGLGDQPAPGSLTRAMGDRGCCGFALLLAIPMTLGAAAWEAVQALGEAVKGVWS